MEVTMTQFQTNWLKLIEDVYASRTEIIITRQGKPVAKVVSLPESEALPFLGSFIGAGETVGDLTEPLDDE